MAKRGQVQLEKLEKPERLEKLEVAPQYVRECGVKRCSYSSYREHSHYQYGDYEFAVARGEEIKEYDGPLFKWLNQDGTSTYGKLTWDLPTEAGPGDWAEPDSKLLSTCAHGLHALLPGQAGFIGARLFVAESRGPVMFTYNKVVTMGLRLIREVDLTMDITPEVERQFWLQVTESLRNRSYQVIPRKYHHLIRNTRKATLTTVRREAKPLIAEDRRLRGELLKFEAGIELWPVLTGKGSTGRHDWDQWRDFKRQRERIRRQLNHLNHIAIEATQRRPTWGTIPAEAIKNPDLKLYRSETPKWQD